MGIFGLGLPEVAVIAGVAVLLFGPSKMPELGKTLGKTVRELQDASKVRWKQIHATLELSSARNFTHQTIFLLLLLLLLRLLQFVRSLRTNLTRS